jgi:hypothetical protein
LTFTVEGVAPVPFLASPTLGFQMAVTNSIPGEAIYSVSLRCQIQIEVTRRSYTPQAQEQLRDLFGEPERWGVTLRNMLWTNVSAAVPPFTESTKFELQTPCTFDFNIAATKYFNSVAEGDIPLRLMFSGTVMYDSGDRVQMAPISWDKESRFRLPVSVWREMMDMYYPNTAWLCLRRDVFERLHQYKIRNGIPTWERALEAMLDCGEETVVQ